MRKVNCILLFLILFVSTNSFSQSISINYFPAYGSNGKIMGSGAGVEVSGAEFQLQLELDQFIYGISAGISTFSTMSFNSDGDSVGQKNYFYGVVAGILSGVSFSISEGISLPITIHLRRFFPGKDFFANTQLAVGSGIRFNLHNIFLEPSFNVINDLTYKASPQGDLENNLRVSAGVAIGCIF